jgi:hypothetical protein
MQPLVSRNGPSPGPKLLKLHTKKLTALQEPAAAPLLWGFVAAVAGAVVAPLDPNLLEEGIVVHTAQRMLEGDHLYRDVVSHTGPLPYEFLALLFQIFGAKLAVARAAVVLLQAVAAAAVFATARRAGLGALAHAAAAAIACAPAFLIPLFSIYYYTTIAFYLGLIAVYAGLRARDSNGWAITAGMLVAAIALCKQNTGVQFAVCFIPAVALCAASGVRLRRAGAVVIGGAAVAIATLALFAARGDLEQLVFAQIQMPFAMASESTFRTPYINFWPIGQLHPVIRESWAMYLPSLYHMHYGLFVEIGRGIVALTQFLYALPFLALAATAIRGLMGRNHAAAWIHAAFLAAMTAGLYPRADWGHLVVALPPALVQILLLFANAPDSSAHSNVGRRAVAAALAGALVIGSAGVTVWLHGIAGPAAFGPHVPLKPVSRAYRGPALPRVISYLRNRVQPGETIFVPRQEPLIYFATGTRNPTPFEGVLPGLRDWEEPIILEALEDIRYVVMSDIDQPIYTYYSDELPAVWAYLERHFRVPPGYPLDDYDWIVVLARGADRGATAVDLVAERSRAHHWVRDESGKIADAPSMPQRLASKLLNRPLPIALGASGGGVDFEVDIPANAVFQAGVGYRGLVSVDHQYIHPRGTTLEVSVRDGDDFEPLASVRIDDRLRSGRSWTPLEADLRAFADRSVTLRLEVIAKIPPAPGDLSWFGSPRIALAPESTPSATQERSR